MPEQISTDYSFHEITNTNEKVVVQFYSRSCGMSRMSQSLFQSIEHNYSVKFAQIDINENPDTADRLNVRNTPVFLFFKNSRKIDELTISGVDDLESRLHNNLVNLDNFE